MILEHFRRAYAYARWATELLLDTATGLTHEQLHHDFETSFHSLHGTLDHLWAVESLWLDRWLGGAPSGLSMLGPGAHVVEFAAAWYRVWEGQRQFIESLPEDRLMQEFSYRNQSGRATQVVTSDMLFHVVNHGTHHRGQIVSLLRQLGIAPPPTDVLRFAQQFPQFAAAKRTASVNRMQ